MRTEALIRAYRTVQRELVDEPCNCEELGCGQECRDGKNFRRGFATALEWVLCESPWYDEQVAIDFELFKDIRRERAEQN